MIGPTSTHAFEILAQAAPVPSAEQQGEAMGFGLVLLLTIIVFAVLWLKFRKSKG